ncbi:MAG TPA: hypothetical protein VHB74_01705 [Devosia sp.]|nr:hypothetical protein [Devosia sp.]
MGKPLVIVALVLGVVFLILAVYYWLTPAGALPGFFPGFEQGVAAHHVKHAIVALVIAVVLFCFAWFQSKPAKTA